MTPRNIKIYAVNEDETNGFKFYEIRRYKISMPTSISDNILIFCDISKAFDRVWHRGLVAKLKSYGFIGDILLWLTYYISNRS